jgi:hypothetical protein
VIIGRPDIEVCETYLVFITGRELICTDLENILKIAHRDFYEYSAINFLGFLVSFQNVLLAVRVYNEF